MKKILQIIIVSILFITTVFSLTACKGDDSSSNPPANTPEVQAPEQPASTISTKEIGQHFMISNGLVDLAASDSHTIVDSRTGVAYTAYLASEEKYGESSTILKVAKYNILAPTNAEWVTVFHYIDDFGGSHISTCNILDLNFDTIRVIVINKGDGTYYYKDVDKKSFAVGEKKELKYKKSKVKGEVAVTMSTDNVNAHITDMGGEAFAYLQISSDIICVNRYYYATVSGGAPKAANFMFVESPDGETWYFVSLIKHRVSYEAMLTYHENKFWIFCRDGSENPTTETYQNLLYSKDEGKTWTLSNLAFTVSDTRPYIFTYQNELYIAYSTPLERDFSVVRTWRCNLHVGKVTSKDGVETYEELLYKESKFGIVYFSLVDWYGKMIML
ncbi:MAG: exo-alpha-sialidase, partial [Clostridia bacterium]|nr:exo-alpha-sialidase [Clostridia bacterium]